MTDDWCSEPFYQSQFTSHQSHFAPHSAAQSSPLTMLNTPLLHPDILAIAARCGHHAKILIADGNYPASTAKGPNAQQVCLQLIPGVPTVAQVLRALMSVLPFDAINTMGIPADDPYAKFGEPPVWKELRPSPPKPARARVRIAPRSPSSRFQVGLLQGRRVPRPRAHQPDRRPGAVGERAAHRRRPHGVAAHSRRVTISADNVTRLGAVA